MTNIEQLLSQFHNLDIQIWLEGDKLRYSAPQNVLTPALKATLVEYKPAIIEFLGTHHCIPPAILPVPRNTDLPLSYTQQRMWFLSQMQGENAVYNLAWQWEITGSLDIAAFEQSWQAIIHRHEILRTTYANVNGKPIQVIAPTLPFSLTPIDLQSLSSLEKSAKVQQLVHEAAKTPFNLAQAPLFRVQLFQMGASEYILLLVMHHILIDAWSFGLLLRELQTLYTANVNGEPSPLPPLARQYADFAVWQRNYLQEKALATDLDYWQQQMQNAPTLLNLPTDQPRTPIQTFAGATHSFLLPEDVSKGIKILSQQAQVTPFMTLLTAFEILLYRYTGQEDILVGSPIANRNHAEITELMGCFLNTLVIRTDVSGNPSFWQLLNRVRDVTLAAYAHQNLPFEKLVEEFSQVRELSHTPFFQVMFSLQNALQTHLDLPNLTIKISPVETATAKFDLTLDLIETASGLVGRFEYNTDLFHSDTITRLAGHFQTLLAAIIAHPHQSINELPLLTVAEQQQLREWNYTQTDYPQDLCIHHLFENWVKQTPDAVAVVFQDEQLTYQQLNQRANQLANYVKTQGVTSEVLVGICVERSLDLVIAVLAVLKAGGAYVPLDPTYPRERLQLMLTDSHLGVLLTQQKLVPELPTYQGCIVCLDQDWPTITTHSLENPPNEVIVNNLAYVIYTSGSTGKPKGVLVTHQGLCNLVSVQKQLFDVQPTSHILQFASLSFDASVWEICMAFGCGARLCIATADALLGAGLVEFLRQQAITHITLPPSVLASLANAELPTLQTIIVAGEACPKELVAKWSTKHRFFNAYGPTEATVCATVAKCANTQAKVSIGRAIANTQTYILDSHLQLVPIGVPGELHIGGVGLARGYLHRPELTAEKFIADPFSDEPNKLLYKTGDLARYLPDGNIEYIGRIDRQVKIRGFRIEVGEIEALLAQHPQVWEVVVSPQPDHLGQKRLIAYIVPQPEQIPTTTQLQNFLQEKLPGYMLPSAFVILESLPLLPNGKVNHHALPKLEDSNQTAEDYVMPQTTAERIIAEIWQELLLREKIGIHDNFFQLGGHSLLLVNLQAQLLAKFQQNISIIDLFKYPTINLLAKYLTQQSSENTYYHQACERAETRVNRQAAIKQKRQLRQEHR